MKGKKCTDKRKDRWEHRGACRDGEREGGEKRKRDKGGIKGE